MKSECTFLKTFPSSMRRQILYIYIYNIESFIRYIRRGQGAFCDIMLSQHESVPSCCQKTNLITQKEKKTLPPFFFRMTRTIRRLYTSCPAKTGARPFHTAFNNNNRYFCKRNNIKYQHPRKLHWRNNLIVHKIEYLPRNKVYQVCSCRIIVLLSLYHWAGKAFCHLRQ